MRYGIVFLVVACLVWSSAGHGVVQARELEYGKLYSLNDGMSADDIMRIVYHNKYSLFAKDFDLPETTIVYVSADGFTRERKALRQRIVKAGDAGISRSRPSIHPVTQTDRLDGRTQPRNRWLRRRRETPSTPLQQLEGGGSPSYLFPSDSQIARH